MADEGGPRVLKPSAIRVVGVTESFLRLPVHIQIVVLGGPSFLVWVGSDEATFDTLALSMPTRYVCVFDSWPVAVC